MSAFHPIGIDNTLDWHRIWKLFFIGLFGGLLLTMPLAVSAGTKKGA